MQYDYQWDRPDWLTRRLALKVTAVAAAVALALSAGLAWANHGSESLPAEDPIVPFSKVVANKDHEFHMGVIRIQAGGQDVTVLEVRPESTTNVDFLGAVTTYGMDEMKGGLGTVGPSFPPAYLRTTHPIGEPIQAFKTSYIPAGWDNPAPIIVTAGFRLTSDYGVVNRVRVIYRVGDKTHTEVVRYAAIACPRACTGPARGPNLREALDRADYFVPRGHSG